MTTADTGDAFLARVAALGFTPPDRSDVLRWGFGILGEADGAEWLVWDAESVVYPEDGSADGGAGPSA